MSESVSTLAATVSLTGISAPTMDQILASLQGSFQSIYGADVYLGPDSQDGQWLGIIAQAIHDCNDTAVFVFNQFSPATAIGTGLSSVVKINGLLREESTNSTTVVTIVGQAGSPLTNCLVGDNENLNTQWSIPSGTIIPFTGTIEVTVTSTTPGNVTVPSNSLTVILTPTPGWQTVTNGTNPVTLGVPIETDAILRQRQSISTAIPGQTVLASIQGGLANLPGVSAVQMYKNDSTTTDGNGLPANSISAVVAGGDAVQIAQTINLYKTPGVLTYGTTSEVVFDSIGVPSTINFFILETITIAVLVQINPLNGYTSNAASDISASIAFLLSNLNIGESSYCGRLWGPANLTGDAATAATGTIQQTLDTISATYSLSVPFGVAQARIDGMVTSATAAGGSPSITVVNGALFFAGEVIFITLTGGGTFQTTVSSIAGNILTLGAAIPSLASVPSDAIVYGVADIPIGFNESATSTAAEVLVVVL